MKVLLITLLAYSFSVLAQERPQLTPDEAEKFSIENYLAQGSTPWQPELLSARDWKPDFVVATDGSGTHRNLQAAFDALPEVSNANSRRYYIQLKPGTYVGAFCVRGKGAFSLYGEIDNPAAVRITGSHYAGEAKRAGIDSANPCVPDLAASIFGTAGSATLVVKNNDVQLAHLTIANDALEGVRDGKNYPPGAGESGGAQGVALLAEGDRIQLQQVHLRGHQDTFYVRRGDEVGRVFVRKSLITGDVDFIFGNAVLIISDSTIVSRSGRRMPGNGGHVFAPSTAHNQPLGFLIANSRLLGEAGLKPGSISLGRAWDHGVAHGAWQADKSPNGQALIRDSVLGAHFNHWGTSTSRRPFAGRGSAANRFAEFGNQPAGIEREILAGYDGWAAMTGGTTGGGDAEGTAVFDVRSRAQLIDALKLANAAKIVRLHGRIDLDADTQGARLKADDFRDSAFNFDAYARAFDPAVWGRQPLTGELEDARKRSVRRQMAHIVMRVPSNTTIIGADAGATLAGGMLLVENADNVIVRNVNFVDVQDYFPAWDPKDGLHGEWNSEYDSLSLRRATHVWIDHCSFADSEHPDTNAETIFGRMVQRHDGLLDITKQSNYVTVSWNTFRDHDKTTVVGGGDKAPDDGTLKVTFHHNLWERVKERAPRVRWGQVHVANNLYIASSKSEYSFAYSIGVGVGSRIISEANVWETAPGVATRSLVRHWGGETFTDRGSIHNQQAIDLLAALQSEKPAINITADVGWVPPYLLSLDPVATLPAAVRAGAGVGKLQ